MTLSSLGVRDPDIRVLVSRHRAVDVNHIKAIVDSINLWLRQWSYISKHISTDYNKMHEHLTKCFRAHKNNYNVLTLPLVNCVHSHNYVEIF